MNRIKTIIAFLRYNALHIFGGRFVVFLGLARLVTLYVIIAALGRDHILQLALHDNGFRGDHPLRPFAPSEPGEVYLN